MTDVNSFSGSMENLSGFISAPKWQGENFTYHDGQWSAYVWLLVIGSFTSFIAAWGIGANDVANSFATSVGSKALTMFQACIIAGVFEFVGAVSLGGTVVKTVKGSITDPSMFKDQPQIFAYGMLGASTSVACVLFLATYLKQAVSTTHTAIGSVLGFGLVYGGADGVTWNEVSDEFPFRKGFTPVVISWFVSPVFTAILSSGFFIITRIVCLQRQASYTIAFYMIPVLMMITIFIVLLAIFLKSVDSGHDREGELNWSTDKKAWVAIVVGAGAGLLTIPYTIWLKISMAKEDNEVHEENVARDAEAAHVAAGGTLKEKTAEEHEAQAKKLQPNWEERFLTWAGNTWLGQRKFMQKFLSAMTCDVHAHVATMDNPKVAQMHADAEVFDPRTEDVFKRMQVITASAVAFVHGANDVANGVGPLAGIWDTYNTYQSGSGKASQPRWILVIGAAGIVFGLAMYGYRIIATLGVDLVVMTPSRGYAVELAGAAIIALASTYGLPVSTTQVITGGEIGVGMCETWKMTGVNWLLFIRTFWGWVGALVTGAILSALFFSIGVYGPSRTDLDYVTHYQRAMKIDIDESMAALLDQCMELQTAGGGGCDYSDNSCSCKQATPYTMGDLKGLKAQADGLFNFEENGQINEYNMMYMLRQINSLFKFTFFPRNFSEFAGASNQTVP
uniref:Phosphate transporter n=1 Tax=Dunaliella viridis TaxID=140095 RepID=Q1HVB1_9CHLO|nr:sodium-coupled phosphate transporter protein [Dunaliella viridis]ACL28157.1 sodium-coupled phosphate transporter protein [Dunaliella viridis]